MACIAAFIFGILQLAAVLLVAVGTPLAMFQPRGEKVNSNSYCVTMWGTREQCFFPRYSGTPESIWAQCGDRLNRFKVAQALSIAAVIILAVSMLASVLDACCCYCIKFLCMLLNVVAVCALGVTFGLMLEAYRNDQGSNVIGEVDVCVKMSEFPGVDGRFPQGMSLGVGFILLVAAAAISLVNAFTILIPC